MHLSRIAQTETQTEQLIRSIGLNAVSSTGCSLKSIVVMLIYANYSVIITQRLRGAVFNCRNMLCDRGGEDRIVCLVIIAGTM